jgi:altronate dehydratase
MSGWPAAAPQESRWDALVIHPDDDVAILLRDVQAGELVGVRHAADVTVHTVTEAIPLGHKFALHAIEKGAPIRKYGERIGAATAAIAAGAHVHVHNMQSVRARKPT